MEYRELTILLRTADTSGDETLLEALVQAAPIGRSPTARFPFPLSRDELDALFADADAAVHAASNKLAANAGVDAQELGHRLFESIMQGEVGDLFRDCLNGLSKLEGMRIRLRFDLKDPHSDYLSALPWELLYDPGPPGRYLAARRKHPVVRDLLTGQRIEPLDVELPLRLLVVDSAPRGMHALDLELEKVRIRHALGDLIEAGRVELECLETPTLDELRRAVLHERIHVLHFMGHGGYLDEEGLGALFFETADGDKEQVSGDMFADRLTDAPCLKLVVLNACRSARYSGAEGRPADLGVAAAILYHAKIPAVVAMQYTVSDPAAIAFAEGFYGAIAAEDPVDAAISEARLRLSGRTPEWATPVLFMTSQDGRLFRFAEPSAEASPPSPGASESGPELATPETARPLRLGIVSFANGWGDDIPARTDACLDLTPFFVGRYIKHHDLWMSEVYPRVRDFLTEHARKSRYLLLDLATHSSIAFACGYVLEMKSRLDIAVRQYTVGHPDPADWYPRDGALHKGRLWKELPDAILDLEAPDVALAVSISRDSVNQDVGRYLEEADLPVGRMIHARVPEPGGDSVEGGTHALRLAETLTHRARIRKPHERRGRLHIFAAAPNAWSFFLGQLSRGLLPLTLYEFDMDGETRSYRPSIRLPLAGEYEPPPGW